MTPKTPIGGMFTRWMPLPKQQYQLAGSLYQGRRHFYWPTRPDKDTLLSVVDPITGALRWEYATVLLHRVEYPSNYDPEWWDAYTYGWIPETEELFIGGPERRHYPAQKGTQQNV